MVYDILIIGAGQAGLTMGYFLKKTKFSFLIVDKANEIGESWKTRYDSLTLFTPRSYSSLPGLTLAGEENLYPSKDEISAYLSSYGNTFSLPIQLNTVVTNLEKQNDTFIVKTNQGEYLSKNVIVATGPFQEPFIPEFSHLLSDKVVQLHSSKYINPTQLIEGNTVIVGGGNSGAQIATEISYERMVYLSVGQPLKYLPQDIGSKSIFWWFDKLGILRANVNSKVGQFIKNKPDPIFGFQLRKQFKIGRVNLKPRVTSADKSQLFFEDGKGLEVSNVIWSTGFKSEYSWINLPTVLDEKGFPIHQRGVTSTKGFYFLGLPWQYRRGSALLQGVGLDAEYLSKVLLQ